MATVDLVLVEDNPGDAVMTQEIIAETGCDVQVTIAENGETAMEVIRERLTGPSNGPVLVLLDLKLPKRDGLEVLSFIRSSFSNDALKVVVLTGSQHPHDRARAMDLSVDHFLKKPIDMNGFGELVVTLKEIITSMEQVPAPRQ